MIEYRFALMGLDASEVDTRRFCNLLLGWLLDDRTPEQRQELLDQLESPDVSKGRDAGLADVYRGQGKSEAWIAMQEDVRHAQTPEAKAAARMKHLQRSKKE